MNKRIDMSKLKFIRSIVTGDETIEKVVRFHWIEYFKIIFINLILIGLGLIYLPLILLIPIYTLYAYLKLRYTEMALTSERVIKKTGIISRKTEQIVFGKVEEVNFDQTILERILGTGKIIFTGSGGSNVVLKSIAEPTEVYSTYNMLN